MIRTPCVARPATRICDTAVRIVRPDRLIIIRSLSSVTAWIEISFPVFSVILIVLTPLPPRFVMRYSSRSVRLPYPFSLSTNTSCPLSGSTQIMPTASSPSSSEMPRTPAPTRPIGRTVRSLKRIALPSRAAIITSASPLVSFASMSWSPSRMTMALTPLLRGRE